MNRIAVGGMGEVYVARRTGAGDFEKLVAVKLLLPHLGEEPEFVQRFLDEARLSARMHHPNIVEIFDLGEESGRPFIAMQLVEGVSLGQLLDHAKRANEKIPLPIARLVMMGVCEALAYAHSLRDAKGARLDIIHRDVTPSNVLLSSAGAVLLMDFGIAKAHGSLHHTEPGKVRGKVTWMAPEQLSESVRAPVSTRSDVYSAALTFYAMLSGRNPFRKESDILSLEAVVSAARPPLVTAYRPDVDAGLAAAIAKAMAFAPSERFADAKTFREALMRGGPVATAPELAAWVQRLGSAELQRFHAAAGMAEASVGPGTRSVPIRRLGPSDTVMADSLSDAPDAPAEAAEPIEHQASITEPTPRRRRLWVVALAASVVGALAFGAVLLAPTTPTVEDVPPPPVVVEPLVEKAVEPVDVVAEPVVDEAEDRAPAVPTNQRRPDRRVKRPVPSSLETKSTEQAIGYLTADADPWAEVLLNGKLLDRTPFARFPVPAGRYTVVFRGPDGAQRKRVVLVEAGREATVRVDMK